MDYEVRQAAIDDGDELLELWHGFTSYLSQYDDRYAHKDSADSRWLSYFENQLVDSKYGTVFVAEHAETDQLIGVLEARVTGDHPIFRLSDHGYINGLFVREQHRGQGVGEQLLEAAADWFRDNPKDVSYYRIDVLDGDDAARQVIEDYGLEPVEHVYEERL
jgi:GNAT superfamily N-acetyltransferase